MSQRLKAYLIIILYVLNINNTTPYYMFYRVGNKESIGGDLGRKDFRAFARRQQTRDI